MAAAEKEPGETPASVDHLAHSHQNVTIMFMDIVGEGTDGPGTAGGRTEGTTFNLICGHRLGP